MSIAMNTKKHRRKRTVNHNRSLTYTTRYYYPPSEEKPGSFADLYSSDDYSNTSRIQKLKGKPLGEITKEFIVLIKSRPYMLIDIDEVVDLLNIPKRRIYSVVNVLESIDLLEKMSCSLFRWIDHKERLEEKILEQEVISEKMDSLIYKASVELEE